MIMAVHEEGGEIYDAIAEGNLERVKTFFPEDGSRSPNIILVSWADVTPLMQACSSNNIQIAEYLIELGADVSFSDSLAPIFNFLKKVKTKIQEMSWTHP